MTDYGGRGGEDGCVIILPSHNDVCGYVGFAASGKSSNHKGIGAEEVLVGNVTVEIERSSGTGG